VRFTAAGQANATLLSHRFDVHGDRTLVLNPEIGRLEWLRGGRQRRVCQAVDVALEGRTLTVANLHATNNSDIARVEVGLAADFVADAQPCILCGDFNVPMYAIQDYSPPIEGIDQILVRGVELERTPSVWPPKRRRVNGALLSDHAPVEAEVAWT
jgi:endonuclease/exonuclease/phosphatase family metal-dependent hydrolase